LDITGSFNLKEEIPLAFGEGDAWRRVAQEGIAIV
jgi:hypothetical protein